MGKRHAMGYIHPCITPGRRAQLTSQSTMPGRAAPGMAPYLSPENTVTPKPEHFAPVSPVSVAWPAPRSPWETGEIMAEQPQPQTVKRNRKKPTLNCSECVSRKTKCDRTRPTCITCLRRQTRCEYTEIANILAATGPARPRKRKRETAQPKQEPSPEATHHQPFVPPPTLTRQLTSPSGLDVVANTNSQQPSALNAVSKEQPAPFNLFGMRSQHPFANYWTSSGGLSEVISLMPRKEDADPLVELYYENVDPLYPIVPRESFVLEHERFWTLSPEEKNAYDAAQLALQLIIYAFGTQHMDGGSPEERANTSDFYISACHQSLCISSYLNRCTRPTIQTMILVSYFLLNNNRISDAWTFSGITHRQVFGMELHRNPEAVHPEESFFNQQIRCRLWQAFMFQDTSLSLYLEMPASTIHHDIEPSCLLPLPGLPPLGQGELNGFVSSTPSEVSNANDVSYLRAAWEYTVFVQRHLCIPKALKRPLSTDAKHKAQLISQYRDMYRSWAPPFNSTHPCRFECSDIRLARQTIAVASNFYYVLTIMYMDKNDAAGVECDVFGALEAAHEALASYFALLRISPSMANTWCAPNTRAFAQTIMIGTILSSQLKPFHSSQRDARILIAKSDFEQYLDILLRARGCADFDALSRKRIADLQALWVSIENV